MHDEALRLAGVTPLSLAGRHGPKRAFVFDPHRLALPCWAFGVEDGPPALLVTLDRHLDLVPPANPARVPARTGGVLALDAFARLELDVRNVDHVLAAMEAGVITDAIAIARARPKGSWEGETYRDREGSLHHLVVAPTVDRFAADFGAPNASATTRRAEELLRNAQRVILDVDLDCFTTPSDAEPTTVVPWPREVIREFLLPPGVAPVLGPGARALRAPHDRARAGALRRAHLDGPAV